MLAVDRQVLAARNHAPIPVMIECPVIDILAGVGFIDSNHIHIGQTHIKAVEGTPGDPGRTAAIHGNVQRPAEMRCVDTQTGFDRDVIGNHPPHRLF